MTLGWERLRFGADVPVDERVATVSDAQHGPIAAAQLRACGLSASGVGRRVANGQLHRLHRGVYVPGYRRMPALGWIAGAVLACGPRSCACNLTAAHLRELRFAGSRILVDVAVGSTNGRCHRHVVTHSARNLRSQDVSVVDGIPTTSVARTLLDCAPILGRRGLEKLTLEAERLGAFDLIGVHDLLGHVTRHPGRAILKDAVCDAAGARGQTASPPEEGLLVEFRALGLDEPECNPPIFMPDGALFYPDFMWRGGALVVEADPRGTHDTTQSYRSDRSRDRKLDAIGLQTMRFHDLELRDLRACAVETAERLAHRRAQGHEFRPSDGQNS